MTSPGQDRGLSDRKRELLAQLVAGKARLAGDAGRTVPRLPPGSELPLSKAQQRLVFLERLYPGNAFNGSLTLEHAGELDVGYLRKALNAVIDRHEVLQTNAVLSDRGVAGRLNVSAGLDLDFTDLSDLPPARQRSEAIRRGNEAVSRPIDIFNSSPLLNVTVLKIGARRHIVILSMHMFVIDAPSGAILLRELILAYGRLCRGLQAFDSPLLFQYADYIAWKERSAPARPDRALDHWVQQLAGSEASLQLPTDRARRSGQGFKARRLPFALAPAMTSALKALARQAGVSFYIVLLAALQTVLFRHTSQPDVSVGAWTIQRDDQNKDLIGPLVNPIVYRTSLRDEDSFWAVLQRLKATAAAAYARAETSFERVVAAVQPRRDISLNPLFQVHFILQDNTLEETGGFSLSPLDAEIGAAGGYDIELVVRDLARGVEGHFECNSSLFDTEAIAELSERFLTVLMETTRNPAIAIGDIAFEGAPAQSDPLTTIAPSLEDQLATLDSIDPRRCAAAWADGEMSHEEFRDLVAGFEDWIEASAPQAVVAVVGARGPETAAAMVAALRRGRPFLSLSEAGASEALARLGGEFSFVGIVVDGISSDTLASLLRICACVSCSQLTGQKRARRLIRAAPPAAPAYFASTSGTTGSPRFVAISREGLADVLCALSQAYGLSERDRILQMARPEFDVAIEETLTTLLANATLVFPRAWPHQGLGGLSSDLCDGQITVANLDGALWQAWSEHLRGNGEAPSASLKTLVIGSETAGIESVRAWQACFGGRIQLIHAYGAAETGITCCLYRAPAEAAPLEDLPRLPIGAPIGRFRTAVCDRRGHTVPAGVVGELHVSGPAVAKKYLGDREETDRRFGGGWFRTGDLARRRHDGELEFLGRNKEKLKLKGVWVELAQVRAKLQELAGVLAAEVVVSGSGMNAVLDLRVWPTRGDPASALEATALRAQLSELMPQLRGVPIGRIEIVGAEETEVSEETADAGTDLMSRLSRLWNEISPSRALARERSVFEQGVVSLDCLRLVGRANEVGLELSIADIYQHQSIQAQVDLLNQRGTADGDRSD